MMLFLIAALIGYVIAGWTGAIAAVVGLWLLSWLAGLAGAGAHALSRRREAPEQMSTVPAPVIPPEPLPPVEPKPAPVARPRQPYAKYIASNYSPEALAERGYVRSERGEDGKFHNVVVPPVPLPPLTPRPPKPPGWVWNCPDHGVDATEVRITRRLKTEYRACTMCERDEYE